MIDQLTQQFRFETMLNELGLSAAEFARRVGLSEVSVSRWRNGKRSIRKDTAKAIELEFPQYSAAWIMGTSPYRNDDDERIQSLLDRSKNLYLSRNNNVDIAIKLADQNGYSVDLPTDHVANKHDRDKRNPDLYPETLVMATIEHLSMQGAIRAKDIPTCVTINNGSESIRVPMDQFEEFSNEISDYAAMRLRRLFSDEPTQDS